MNPNFLICMLLAGVPLASAAQVGYITESVNLCETGRWIQIWGDEFDGTSIDTSKWITYANDGCYYANSDDCLQSRYDAPGNVIFKDENVVVGGGICTLILKKDQGSTWKGHTLDFSSGRIGTPNMSGRRILFNRGRFTARIRVSGAKNAWSTFWLWGAGKWGKISEIDIAEYNASHPDRMTYSLHNFPNHEPQDFTNNYTRKRPGSNRNINWSQAFHIYTVDWDEHFVSFYIDSIPLGTFSRIAGTQNCVAAPGHYMVYPGFPDINEFMGVNFTLALKKPQMNVGKTFMEIDWVRVYKRDPCADDLVITDPELFPFEILTKNKIVLGTQSLRPWTNMTPQWEPGHYQANSITMLPGFVSEAVWIDPTPEDNQDSQNDHYSSFIYEATPCKMPVNPVLKIHQP